MTALTELFTANFAVATVSTGGATAPSAGSSETWTVASSAMFGAATTGVSVFHVSDQAAGKTGEIIAVTNVSGTTWTVTRGAEGTTPVTHSAPFSVQQAITAGFLAYLATLSGGGGSGTVTSVAAADASIVVSGTPTTTPTVATGTLDVVATQHPPAAAWSNNSKKITNVANGSGAQDAAAFGQLPSSSTPLALTAGGTGLSESSNAALLNGLGAASLSGAAFTGEVTVPPPVNPSNPVTKSYADAIASGLSVKPSVQEATTAALPSNTYASGALTATANGVLTVDGLAVSLGDRILVQNEATAANNGIYTCTTAGASGAAYVLTRAADMASGSQVPGAFVFVEQGTANAGAGFTVAAAGPFTIGTTAINWTQFSGAGEVLPGSGLAKTGNTLSLASSPALTGSPTAPTQAGTDNSTKLATTAYVTSAVTSLGLGSAATQPSSAFDSAGAAAAAAAYFLRVFAV